MLASQDVLDLIDRCLLAASESRQSAEETIKILSNLLDPEPEVPETSVSAIGTLPRQVSRDLWSHSPLPSLTKKPFEQLSPPVNPFEQMSSLQRPVIKDPAR